MPSQAEPQDHREPNLPPWRGAKHWALIQPTIRGIGLRVKSMSGGFSVIIPTLQKSERLIPLLEMYCAHHRVAEVIVINNAAAEIPFAHRKLRVLQQTENLFVNPSWNLGVSEANEDCLIISNDDIHFDPDVIDFSARLLRLPVGVIGCAPDALGREEAGRYWALPTYRMTQPFGVLMFLRKRDYVPIPNELLVWAGDSWLFDRQRRRNVILKGVRLETEMSTTASSPEFLAIKHQDNDVYLAEYQDSDRDERFRRERRLLAMAHRLRHGRVL
jgi:glycosyltransferase involved in cell wall biosynthesis